MNKYYWTKEVIEIKIGSERSLSHSFFSLDLGVKRIIRIAMSLDHGKYDIRIWLHRHDVGSNLCEDAESVTDYMWCPDEGHMMKVGLAELIADC